MEDCEVFVDNDFVSRYHAEIVFENGRWWIRDLGSSNGIYVGTQRVEFTPIQHTTTIRLGIYGPELSLEVDQPSTPDSPPAGSQTVLSRYVDHYFGKATEDETVGQHTMYVRQAFAHVQTKQKRKYDKIIAALVVAMMVAGSYAFYEGLQNRKQKAIAGSVGVPLNHLVERVQELPKDRQLLVYCAGGYRSSIAASLLQREGFTHVSEIAGGIAGWETANLPTGRGPASDF